VIRKKIKRKILCARLNDDFDATKLKFDTAAAAILKNPKIAIFQQRFDQSLRHLAWHHSSTPLTRPTVKNF